MTAKKHAEQVVGHLCAELKRLLVPVMEECLDETTTSGPCKVAVDRSPPSKAFYHGAPLGRKQCLFCGETLANKQSLFCDPTCFRQLWCWISTDNVVLMDDI
jgi:hypothetical protein